MKSSQTTPSLMRQTGTDPTTRIAVPTRKKGPRSRSGRKRLPERGLPRSAASEPRRGSLSNGEKVQPPHAGMPRLLRGWNFGATAPSRTSRVRGYHGGRELCWCWRLLCQRLPCRHGTSVPGRRRETTHQRAASLRARPHRTRRRKRTPIAPGLLSRRKPTGAVGEMGVQAGRHPVLPVGRDVGQLCRAHGGQGER